MDASLSAASLSREEPVDKVIFLAWDLADRLSDLAKAGGVDGELAALRGVSEFAGRCVAHRMADTETMARHLEETARFIREQMY